MQIDLRAFCSDIRQSEAGKCLDSSEVSPYLMQNLFIPYLSGKDVRLDSLDYDKFTMSDMDGLFKYIGDAGDVGQKLGFMLSRLRKCDPAARKIKGFC